jgi:hypothetical protein
MSQLKKLQLWISAYEKANDVFPDSKALKFKIKELLKEETVEVKSSSKKVYFRDCKWSDYVTLRDELIKDKKFVIDYKGVDLKAYIDSAMAWSETYSKTSTDKGWLLTLRNWMRNGKSDGKLIMKPVTLKYDLPKGHINY